MGYHPREVNRVVGWGITLGTVSRMVGWGITLGTVSRVVGWGLTLGTVSTVVGWGITLEKRVNGSYVSIDHLADCCFLSGSA